MLGRKKNGEIQQKIHVTAASREEAESEARKAGFIHVDYIEEGKFKDKKMTLNLQGPNLRFVQLPSGVAPEPSSVGRFEDTRKRL